jgi:hypothetical protein
MFAWKIGANMDEGLSPQGERSASAAEAPFISNPKGSANPLLRVLSYVRHYYLIHMVSGSGGSFK